MKTKTLLASLALAGFVIAQPASAATRSIDTLDNAERVGSLDGEAEGIGGGSPILWIVLLAAAIGGLIILSSDDEEPQSP